MTHNYSKWFSIVAIILLFGMGCSSKTGANNSTPDTTKTDTFKGAIAKMKFGSKIFLTEENVSIEFSKVTNDSRCPKGGECIHQGNVSVELTLEKKGEFVKKLTLSDLEQESTQEIGHVIIKLKSVSPYPEVNKKVEVQDYVIVLEKSKKINQGNQ